MVPSSTLISGTRRGSLTCSASPLGETTDHRLWCRQFRPSAV